MAYKLLGKVLGLALTVHVVSSVHKQLVKDKLIKKKSLLKNVEESFKL